MSQSLSNHSLCSAATDLEDLKTALVYDWVSTAYGGAEQVIVALKQLFPHAPIYTSVYDPNQARWASNYTVIPSFLQKIPSAAANYRWLLPLMPLSFESLDLSEYDLVISISSGEAKGVITKPGQTYLSYLLSPPRHLYSHREAYLHSRSIFKLPPIRWAASKILDYVTWWDQAAVHRPDAIIPISQLVADRVKTYYPQIKPLPPIYPPVDVHLKPIDSTSQQFLAQQQPLPQQHSPQLPKHKSKSASIPEQRSHQPDMSIPTYLNLPDQFGLIVSRLVAYKHIGAAIQACVELNQPLVIVGTGPEKRRLINLAAKSSRPELITFLGSQPQAFVNWLYQQADFYLSPGVEDFGLSPLQALWYQTPTVINERSGAAEVIEDQKHGVLLKEDRSNKHTQAANVSTIKSAISQLLSIDFDPNELHQQAARYSTQQFLQKMTNVIKQLVFS